MKKFEFKVDAGDAGARLDAFIGRNLPEISREKIKKNIKGGACKVDGEVVLSPSKRLSGEQLLIFSFFEDENTLKVEEGELALLWHDQSMAVLNKPAGIIVHPCPSCPDHTLVNRLLSYFSELKIQAGPRPGIVHRLDKETSGILLIALTEETRLRLAALFAAREVKKEYLALVYGVPESSGSINCPIGRNPSVKTRQAIIQTSKGGKEAITDYEVLYADPGKRYALIRLRIHTGRTHQIRVHMAHLGHPLIGDSTYGKSDAFSPRQMLHAWRVRLPHPLTGAPLDFLCLPPDDFINAALKLAETMRRIIITGLPGCGKSSLGKILGEYGLPFWSADESVAKLYKKGNDGWLFLHGRYGGRFTPEDEPGVNRGALFAAMKENFNLRKEVEETIHALVSHDLDAFWKIQENAGKKSAVAEIPLYFEAGIDSFIPDCDKRLIVGVSCPAPARAKRLRENRGWSEETIADMDSWQWPEDKKMKACDFVIDNSADEEQLVKAAPELLNKIETLYAEKNLKLSQTLFGLFRGTN